jgi:type II secretory pathway pseudopilin PulG
MATPARRPNANGLTLPEFLIVAAIALIIGAVLLTIALTGGKLWRSGEAAVQAQEEARRALTNMSRELRETAITPNPPIPGANAIAFQVILGYDLDGTVAGCLDQQVCVGARNATGVPQQGWSFRYRRVGTQLLREILKVAPSLTSTSVQGTPSVLANNVTGVTFSVPTTDTVTISVTTTAREGGVAGPEHRHRADARVRLRNAP